MAYNVNSYFIFLPTVALLYQLVKKERRWWVLLGASVVLSSAMSLYYAPVMLVLGLVMGALTSVTLRAILPALGRLGYNTREKRG